MKPHSFMMFEGASGGALRAIQVCVNEKSNETLKHVENFSLPTFSTSRIHAKSRLTQRKPKNSGVN